MKYVFNFYEIVYIETLSCLKNVMLQYWYVEKKIDQDVILKYILHLRWVCQVILCKMRSLHKNLFNKNCITLNMIRYDSNQVIQNY